MVTICGLQMVPDLPHRKRLRVSEHAPFSVLACSRLFPLGPSSLGSTHLTGDGHSLRTIDRTIPPAVGNDSQSIILKIPESIRSSGDHFHLGMEAFSDAVGFTETPHGNGWALATIRASGPRLSAGFDAGARSARESREFALHSLGVQRLEQQVTHKILFGVVQRF